MQVIEDGAFAVVTEVIRRRRSVKPTEMDPAREVAEVLLGQLLENATWAPTHGLTQPWRFVVFSGEGARRALASRLQEIYAAEVPPASFREDKYQKLGRNPLLAPVVVALGMSACPGGKIPVKEEVAAVACAAQNLMLSAAAAGLGSFWSSPPILASRAMGEFLGWDGPLDECLGLLYLGWPREGVNEPVSARDGWGSKTVWYGAGPGVAGPEVEGEGGGDV